MGNLSLLIPFSVMPPSTRNSDDAMNDALLEKLRSCITKMQENTDTIRHVMAKLHARVTSSGEFPLHNSSAGPKFSHFVKSAKKLDGLHRRNKFQSAANTCIYISRAAKIL